jgi:hypothetical protein
MNLSDRFSGLLWERKPEIPDDRELWKLSPGDTESRIA